MDYCRGNKCLKHCKIHSFHFLSFSKDFKNGIQNTKGVMLKGLDDYMILDEQTFRIGIDKGTLLVLNFEFLLVLNHDCVTWDYPKREDIGEKINFYTSFWEE
jgi:hypothetical protein